MYYIADMNALQRFYCNSTNFKQSSDNWSPMFDVVNKLDFKTSTCSQEIYFTGLCSRCLIFFS